MAKLVVFGPFWGFISISLDFDAMDGGMAQCLCPRQWVGLNVHARGGGCGLMPAPEAMGGGLNAYA